MQSLLFPSADSAKKLDKAMTSGADALIIDLEDSMTLDSKTRARESARLSRPRSGLTDADLDAIVPARPDVIMLPKAEGGASVVHADAKLAACEAIAGLPDGPYQNDRARTAI
jgi:citrate lyase subunit beta/citryl-CoA lyase